MALIQINRNPTARVLRWFAAFWVLFVGFWGFVLPREAGLAAWAAAIAVGAADLWRPRAIRWVYLGLCYLTFPIGWTLSHLVLAFVYYFLLTPIGVIMRLTGRDPLHRRFEPSASSYWVPHRPPDETGRYFRQF